MTDRTFRRASALVLTATITLAAAGHAAAGERHGSRTVQGPLGRGFVGSGSFVREPGLARYEAQRVYNSGRTESWSGGAHWSAGTLTRERSHTGVVGATQSGWRTLTRTEDGLMRTTGLSTSRGRGYTATGEASRTEDGLVVSRSVTTATGKSASRTRTYPRMGGGS